MSALLDEDRRDDDLRHLLRREVGAAEFDVHQLAAGVHLRARRLRRRRAITTGAAVAAIGSVLVGGTAVVLPSMLPGGIGTVVPAAVTEVPPGEHDGSSPATALQTDSSLEEAAAAQPQSPPFQDSAPLPAEDGSDGGGAGPVNAWDIPDARPTGIAHLDGFGAPRQSLDYPRLAPLSGGMSCNTGVVDVEPVAGQTWSYYTDSGFAGGAIDIHITGWDDSRLARDLIRDDAMTACVRATDSQWHTVGASEDLLLYRADSGDLRLGFALVRQGDYLIGVTVTNTDGPYNADVAAEIATKTAANLAALDRAHGRD